MMSSEEIKDAIESALPGSRATVDGDGRHFQALVVCEGFAGKSILQQHRMVYDALGAHFQNENLHALSLTTRASD
jgi:acid stress-induced BolA-like protein IbaG/YrbA